MVRFEILAQLGHFESNRPLDQTNRLVDDASFRLTIKEICTIQVSEKKLDPTFVRTTYVRVIANNELISSRGAR